MALYSMAGCRFYIGATIPDKPDDFVAADFNGQTWTEVDGWSTMGEFGDNFAEITTALINRARDVKQKGTANAGSMNNTFAVIRNDPGQLALFAAANSRNNYAIRIVFNDEVGAGDPSQALFIGLVMSTREAGGGANDVRNMTVMVSINSNIVLVPAT